MSYIAGVAWNIKARARDGSDYLPIDSLSTVTYRLLTTGQEVVVDTQTTTHSTTGSDWPNGLIICPFSILQNASIAEGTYLLEVYINGTIRLLVSIDVASPTVTPPPVPLLIGDPVFSFRLADNQSRTLSASANKTVRIVPIAMRSTLNSPIDALTDSLTYEVAADVVGQSDSLTYVGTTKEATGSVKFSVGPTGDIVPTAGTRLRFWIRVATGVDDDNATMLQEVFTVDA